MGNQIRNEKNIFCIETELDADLLKESTSKHFLEQLHNFSEGKIKYIYRRCGTIEELEFYFNKLKYKKYASYSIVYFSSHGFKNSVIVGSKKINLQSFENLVGNSLSGKLLHFGGCETMKITKPQRRQFFSETGVSAMSGFTKDVSFIEAAALELLFFDRIRDFKSIRGLENKMIKDYPGLVKSTGFKIYYD